MKNGLLSEYTVHVEQYLPLVLGRILHLAIFIFH